MTNMSETDVILQVIAKMIESDYLMEEYLKAGKDKGKDMSSAEKRLGALKETIGLSEAWRIRNAYEFLKEAVEEEAEAQVKSTADRVRDGTAGEDIAEGDPCYYNQDTDTWHKMDTEKAGD